MVTSSSSFFSMSSLGYKALWNVINFLLLFIYLRSSIKNNLEYIKMEDCPGIYSFDEVSATEFGFKKYLVFLFGLVLWHIKDGWLFNAKFCFYIYIKYMICKLIL